MKKWLLYFSSFLFLFTLKAQAISLQGYVFRVDGEYYFSDRSTSKSYRVVPANSESQAALSRLNSYDTLIGHGSYGPRNTVYIDSIDFVSLRRLIGIWKDSSVFVNFVDYSRVLFEVKSDNRLLSQYHYAIAPAEGDNWRIFFTDQSSVVLGSLTVQNHKAQIEVYDPKNGEVSQRYDLKKIDP